MPLQVHASQRFVHQRALMTIRSLLYPQDNYAKEQEEYIQGSPICALKLDLEKSFDQYYFFDMDKIRTDKLNALKKDYPDKSIIVRNGDSNQLILEHIDQFKKPSTRGIVFLDPYGPHIKWKTLEALASTKKMEVIINLQLPISNRMINNKFNDISENNRKHLNDFFGTEEWEEIIFKPSNQQLLRYNSHDVQEEKIKQNLEPLTNFYVKRLKHLFGYTTKPLPIKNNNRVTIYFLIWAGGNPIGTKIAEGVFKEKTK